MTITPNHTVPVLRGSTVEGGRRTGRDWVAELGSLGG